MLGEAVQADIAGWTLSGCLKLFYLGASLLCRIKNRLKASQNLAQDQSADNQRQAKEGQPTGLRNSTDENEGGIHIERESSLVTKGVQILTF